MQNSSQAAEYLKSAASAIQRGAKYEDVFKSIQVALLLMQYDAGCDDACCGEPLVRATLDGLATFQDTVDRS